MFAIIRTGGKQYKTVANQLIQVEKLDFPEGAEVILDKVLMLSDDKVTLGAPTIPGVVVRAQVVEHMRTRKVIVFKKKRRQNYRRKHGHRQDQTVLRILEIVKG